MRNVTENLPRELLREIFHLALAYIPGDWLHNLYLSCSRLTCVCRRWRDIAISDPMLWTTVVLEEPSFKLPTPSFLRLYIDRSGDLPLSVHLETTLEKKRCLSPNIFELVKIVGAEIHRWKSFTYITQFYTRGPLRTLIDIQFDFSSARQLQYTKFEIDGHDQYQDRSLYDLYAELVELPVLRAMTLRAPDMFGRVYEIPSHMTLKSPQITESWKKWTSLELTSDVAWQDVVFLVRHCSSIKLMRLMLYGVPNNTHIPHPFLVTQNTLCVLCIHFTLCVDKFSLMFDALAFPHLKVFRYKDSGGPSSDGDENFDSAIHWSNFFKMITRSPQLQVLIVTHPNFGQEGCLEFVSQPTVTRIPTVQVLIDRKCLEESPPSESDSRDFYIGLVGQGPNGLIQAVLLEEGGNFLVGWVEEWVMFKEFEGVGRLVDNGFGLHPVLERASRPLTP